MPRSKVAVPSLILAVLPVVATPLAAQLPAPPVSLAVDGSDAPGPARRVPPGGVGVRKIQQLIGDRDTTLRIDTRTRTNQFAGIAGTDLGSSFEHKGRLYFLFGDTNPSGGRDTMTYTTATSPQDLTFVFPFASGGQFHPITIPGATHGGFCIPSGGVSYRDVMYIVYTNNYYAPNGDMETSYMCRSVDDGRNWTNLYRLSGVGANHDMRNTHFINVSMSIVEAAASAGLPYPGQDNLVIFGSGAYRKSALYLAAMPAAAIGTRSGLRYFAGFSGGVPQWGAAEAAAVSLKTAASNEIGTNIGEFSAQLIPELAKWVTLFRGVKISLADAPWGPFSEPVTLWDAWGNDGYGDFIHVPRTHRPPYDDFGCTGVSCMTAPEDWGGPYGPYLIPRFTTGHPGDCQLYFTLSTWNPYTVVLLRAQWPPRPDPPGQFEMTIAPWSEPSWQRTPGNWWRTFERVNTHTGDVVRTMTTWGPRGDGDVGVMWGWLPRDGENRTLGFYVHGGHQEVILLEGDGTDVPVTGNFTTIYSDIKAGRYGRVVACAWGHDDNALDCRVEWDLRGYERANLRVVILDKDTATGWNFVSVGPMTLKRAR